MQDNNCKVIAFLNEKGGVGKTTTTVSVGTAMAMKGKKVLMIDLDPQCSLSMTYGIEDPSSSINDALTKQDAKIQRLVVRENLHVIPSDIYLSSVDMFLAAQLEREKILTKLLEKFRPQYDYILLDCPPYLGILTINALIACDKLIVPVCAETLCVKGMQVLEDMLDKIKSIKKTEISGIVVTRFDSRRSLNENLKRGLECTYGEKVFKTVIRENTDIAKAPTFKKVIYEYAPNSHGAEDYLKLTEEILERFEK